MGPFSNWLINAPLWLVALALVISLIVFAMLGWWLRQRVASAHIPNGIGADQEGYVLGAVSGLLALLIGFTFSMAIDRFDTRRGRVLEEANAIEATYLKAQLLGEPYRTNFSRLLTEYVDNKILLGEAKPGRRQDVLLANSERIKTELWGQTIAVFPSIKGLDFSSSFVDTVSGVMEMDAARKAGRRAHVPGQVYAILFVYLVVAAGVFGYVLTGRRGREVAAFLLLLFAMSMILVIEIDRPVTGRINESQDAMIQLKETLRERPPQIFARFNAPAQAP
jgi:hypothetical protein